MKKIGIIGIGNPLRRDDGIGIVLLERLKKIKEQLPPEIEYIDGGTGGMNLLHILARFDTVIIIDAVNFNEQPGKSRLCTIKDFTHEDSSIKISSHESDIFKVLHLSKKLKENPDKLYFFCIQPKNISYGCNLSTELNDIINKLTYQLKKEIESIFDKNRI